MKRRKIKTASRDFEENDLPASRLAQYFSIFKERFRMIAWLSFLTSLFFLPFLLVLFFKDFHLLAVTSNLENPDESTLQQARVFFPASFKFSVNYYGMSQFFSRRTFVKG